MNKRIISIILIILLLISGICLFGLKNTRTDIVSNSQQFYKTAPEELLESQEKVDNWSLGLVFYDSEVDNGNTALTEINWDASDGSYRKGIPRVITVQINYKNTNAITTYNPGDLEISIPNLISIGNTQDAQWITSVIVGANDSTHLGYDWDFISGTSPSSQETYNFKNAVTIEENSNFEGSIQIVYTITPNGDNELSYYPGSYYPEKYEDECIHDCFAELQANLEDITESNKIQFNYTRTYTHNWKYKPYTVTKTASKILSYDGLGNDAENYIWVKYTFEASCSSATGYPYISANNLKFVDHLPEECLIFDTSENELSNDVSISFSVSSSTYSYSTSIFVGYPKKIYREDNINVINELELWGKYENKSESEILDTDDVTINLSDFKFSYSGNLYGIEKYTLDTINDMYYQSIIGNGHTATWDISPNARYTGTPMTLKIGDDLLYATNIDGKVERLSDEDYYFSSIMWFATAFRNGNGNIISAEKYDCELWVRYKNTDSYVLYSKFKNPSSNKTWTFSNNDVVSWYVIINDMTESAIQSESYSLFRTNTVFKTIKDIPETGTLYNFDYMQVYFKDNNGELLLQNLQTLDNYSNFITKEEIASFDIKEYGNYIQRGTNKKNWSYHYVSQITHSLDADKSFGKITQDVENELFTGTCQIGTNIYSTTSSWEKDYITQYDENYMVKGFKLYDLLPTGMELISSEEEIAKTASINLSIIMKFYDSQFNPLTVSQVKDDLISEVKITRNWNGTGRTRIEVTGILNTPVYILMTGGNSSPLRYCYFNYSYNYNISYDAFLEYGSVWKNYCYVDTLPTQVNGINFNYKVLDNGYYDEDAIDIDEDGLTTDYLSNKMATTTITSVISTHQDVTKYVQTDQSNFTTGRVKATPGSEYTYKLRVRSGSNDVTNLVIYDSIEEYTKDNDGNMTTSYGKNNHWNGEFLGIDTSYAEKNGYKVKVYYSENVKVGNLSEDSSWKEYTESIDKSKVKSLAFEYLDSEGNSAIIPANSLTYVLINLKAPEDEDLITLAYNGFWTQWNAIDAFGSQVDYITGIQSNIVKVSTNSYFSMKVDKIWDDLDNIGGFRPESIDIVLYKNDEEIDRKQIVNGSTSVVFENLLVDDIESYTVKEEVDETSLKFYNISEPVKEDDDKYTITNILKDEFITDISGIKTWIGDTENDRPETITINLLQNGEIYRTTTTDNSKDWEYIFEDIPVCDRDGNYYEYEVEEEPIEFYEATYIGFDIENNFNKPETISGQKIWNDADNQDGIRPESITINLYADEEKIASKTVTEKDDWKWTFENLPKNKNGKEISYTITEDEVDGYTTEVNDYDVTNTHVPEETEVTVQKFWNDYNNYDGIRPQTVQVQLYADRNAFGEPVSLDITNDWKYTWTNLPKKQYGEDIKYTVKELGRIFGYEASYSEDTFTITNTHEPVKLSIKGNKTWDDADNQDGIRPESITINLYADEEKIASKIVTEADDWSWRFDNLDKYDYGKVIVYTITEDEVEGYRSIVNGYNVTNIHDAEKISVSGIKTWEDNENQDGVRPESITINLFADGEKIDSKVVTENDGWKWTFDNLDKYKNGVEIQYTITEENVENYTSKIEGYDITNIHTPEETGRTVQKVWKDANNQDGIRPESIKVQLFSNGEEYGEAVELNNENNWKYTWESLPEKKSGETIEYTVKEIEEIPGYTSNCDNENFIITNTHEPEQISISGSKIWDDADNQDGIRPEQITINLMADDKKIDSKTITEKSDWKWTFDNLDKYENGKEIVYTITEDEVEEYISQVEGYDVINTHKPEQISVSGNKIWDDADNQDGIRPEQIIVNLLANGQKIDSKTVTEEEEWSWTFENLDKYKNGIEIVYSISEDKVDNYTTKVEEYNITNKHVPAQIEKTVQKIWEDEDDYDGLRPDSIFVQIFADEKEHGEPIELNEENNWSYTWSNLQKNKAGKAILYTVKEIGQIDEYDVTYSEDTFTITNTHKPVKITVEGKKTWNDNDDQDKIRPESITINLLADGEKLMSKTVTEKDNWKWTFDNLDKYSKGKEIIYTITEDEVEGYESKIEGYNVTNTHIHVQEVPNVIPNNQTIIKNIYNNIINNSTTNISNDDNKSNSVITTNSSKIPNTGDIIPVISIGTIILVLLSNIIVTILKRKNKQ